MRIAEEEFEVWKHADEPLLLWLHDIRQIPNPHGSMDADVQMQLVRARQR